MGATFCGKVQEENNEKYPKEWLGDISASSHIIHKEEINYICQKMWDQCHSGKCLEDEGLDKRICIHEATRWTNGETYGSPVPDSIYEKYFERFSTHLKGRHDWGSLRIKMSSRKRELV